LFVLIVPQAQPEEIDLNAGFEYFRNFERDAEDFQQLAQQKLTMPVRVISGEKSGGAFLIDQVKLVANDVQGQVIPGSGHWLLEEAPEKVIPVLTGFVH
jgi:pimeloyl-ACP methyl ester carboxylesterase